MPDDTTLTLADLQAAVDDWISQWESGYWPPLSNLARLSEEVGELARILNIRHGEKPAKDELPDDALVEEIGDILFVVVTIANSLDVDLEEAFQHAIDKYDLRDADRFTER